MKKTILALAAGCALIATLGHFYAKPVMAQVRAALIQNIDERGRNPYIQQMSCIVDNEVSCGVSFPTVPANMMLVVEHINVLLDTTTPVENVNISGNEFVECLFLTLQGKDYNGYNLYIANLPFLTYYSAGQTPRAGINVQLGSNYHIIANVTLTGYLVNLNN